MAVIFMAAVVVDRKPGILPCAAARGKAKGGAWARVSPSRRIDLGGHLSQAKKGISALALQRGPGVLCPAPRRLHQTIDRAMADEEAGRLRDAAAPLDDASQGGARAGGQTGRGSQDKVPFAAALSLDEGGRTDPL
jgi:hypothetical protein